MPGPCELRCLASEPSRGTQRRVKQESNHGRPLCHVEFGPWPAPPKDAPSPCPRCAASLKPSALVLAIQGHGAAQHEALDYGLHLGSAWTRQGQGRGQSIRVQEQVLECSEWGVVVFAPPGAAYGVVKLGSFRVARRRARKSTATESWPSSVRCWSRSCEIGPRIGGWQTGSASGPVHPSSPRSVLRAH